MSLIFLNLKCHDKKKQNAKTVITLLRVLEQLPPVITMNVKTGRRIIAEKFCIFVNG